jgi:transcriptional regulator
MDKQLDLLQGTLDMLILKAISLSPLHGYGILLRIQQISKERLEIQQGSLYPALYRLEHQGWIASEWGESENKRRARYYRLTAAGKPRLQSESQTLERNGRGHRRNSTGDTGGVMNLWARFRSWTAAMLQRTRTEREMDDEMRFHIEAVGGGTL